MYIKRHVASWRGNHMELTFGDTAVGIKQNIKQFENWSQYRRYSHAMQLHAPLSDVQRYNKILHNIYNFFFHHFSYT